MSHSRVCGAVAYHPILPDNDSPSVPSNNSLITQYCTCCANNDVISFMFAPALYPSTATSPQRPTRHSTTECQPTRSSNRWKLRLRALFVLHLDRHSNTHGMSSPEAMVLVILTFCPGLPSSPAATSLYSFTTLAT